MPTEVPNQAQPAKNRQWVSNLFRKQLVTKEAEVHVR